MMKSTILPAKFLLMLILGFFVVMSPYLLRAAEEKAVESPEQIAAEAAKQKTTLINIYSWATILPKELIDLQNDILKEKKI